MTLPILFAAIAGVAIWALVEAWLHWRASRMMAKALDRARHPERYASEPPVRLEPESRVIVHVSDSEIVCERPDGKVERVGWAELETIEIVTTDDGPFAPDVFWVLRGRHSGCAVPQGATGDRLLLERLQALPGFDNNAVIDAMSSTSNRRFLCWQKTGMTAR